MDASKRLDQLLDRVAELLKACDAADGDAVHGGFIATAAVRHAFRPQAAGHPSTGREART